MKDFYGKLKLMYGEQFVKRIFIPGIHLLVTMCGFTDAEVRVTPELCSVGDDMYKRLSLTEEHWHQLPLPPSPRIVLLFQSW